MTYFDLYDRGGSFLLARPADAWVPSSEAGSLPDGISVTEFPESRVTVRVGDTEWSVQRTALGTLAASADTQELALDVFSGDTSAGALEVLSAFLGSADVSLAGR